MRHRDADDRDRARLHEDADERTVRGDRAAAVNVGVMRPEPRSRTTLLRPTTYARSTKPARSVSGMLIAIELSAVLSGGA